MTSSPSWITVAPSAPAVGIIERRAVRLPGARPGKPDITPGEYSNGAFGENHSGDDTHQGRWCFGKTPMQTFLDTLPLAKEKLMAA